MDLSRSPVQVTLNKIVIGSPIISKGAALHPNQVNLKQSLCKGLDHRAKSVARVHLKHDFYLPNPQTPTPCQNRPSRQHQSKLEHLESKQLQASPDLSENIQDDEEEEEEKGNNKYVVEEPAVIESPAPQKIIKLHHKLQQDENCGYRGSSSFSFNAVDRSIQSFPQQILLERKMSQQNTMMQIMLNSVSVSQSYDQSTSNNKIFPSDVIQQPKQVSSNKNTASGTLKLSSSATGTKNQTTMLVSGQKSIFKNLFGGGASSMSGKGSQKQGLGTGSAGGIGTGPCEAIYMQNSSQSNKLTSKITFSNYRSEARSKNSNLMNNLQHIQINDEYGDPAPTFSFLRNQNSNSGNLLEQSSTTRAANVSHKELTKQTISFSNLPVVSSSISPPNQHQNLNSNSNQCLAVPTCATINHGNQITMAGVSSGTAQPDASTLSNNPLNTMITIDQQSATVQPQEMYASCQYSTMMMAATQEAQRNCNLNNCSQYKVQQQQIQFQQFPENAEDDADLVNSCHQKKLQINIDTQNLNGFTNSANVDITPKQSQRNEIQQPQVVQQYHTPCETEITQHYDMDEHRNNGFPMSTHRKNHTTNPSNGVGHFGKNFGADAQKEVAVAPNLGEKYLSIVKKQPHLNNQVSSQMDTKRSYHVNNVSVCLTEEIPHKSTINPVNLADKDWTDPYKLNKLVTQWRKNHYMANQIFGNVCSCSNPLAPKKTNLLNSCSSFNGASALLAQNSSPLGPSGPINPGAPSTQSHQLLLDPHGCSSLPARLLSSPAAAAAATTTTTAPLSSLAPQNPSAVAPTCQTQARISELFENLGEYKKKMQSDSAAKQQVRQQVKKKQGKSVRINAARLKYQQQQYFANSQMQQNWCFVSQGGNDVVAQGQFIQMQQHGQNNQNTINQNFFSQSANTHAPELPSQNFIDQKTTGNNQEILPSFFNQGNDGQQISSINQTGVGTGLTTKMSHRQNYQERVITSGAKNCHQVNKSETTSEKLSKNTQNVFIDQSESQIQNPSLEDVDTDSDSSYEAYNQFLRNNFNDMSQITVTQSLHQSQVMGIGGNTSTMTHNNNKSEIPVLFEDKPLQIDPLIKVEESKFGQAGPPESGPNAGHYQSYQHNPGLSKDSFSFDNTNINNISSFGGSFINMGRPSDMNEERIISKETMEARLKAQKMNQKTVVVNQKHVQGHSHLKANQNYNGLGKITNENQLHHRIPSNDQTGIDNSTDNADHKNTSEEKKMLSELEVESKILKQQCANISRIDKNNQSVSGVLEEVDACDLEGIVAPGETNDNSQQAHLLSNDPSSHQASYPLLHQGYNTHFTQYKKNSNSVQQNKLNNPQIRAGGFLSHNALNNQNQKKTNNFAQKDTLLRKGPNDQKSNFIGGKTNHISSMMMMMNAGDGTASDQHLLLNDERLAAEAELENQNHHHLLDNNSSNVIEQSYNTNNTNTNKNRFGDDSEIFMPSQYNTTFDHKAGPSGSSEHLTNIHRIGNILAGTSNFVAPHDSSALSPNNIHAHFQHHLHSRQPHLAHLTGTEGITTTTILQGDITAEHMPMMNVEIPQGSLEADSRNLGAADGSGAQGCSVFGKRQQGLFKTDVKKRGQGRVNRNLINNTRQKSMKKMASPVQKKKLGNKTALNDISMSHELDDLEDQPGPAPGRPTDASNLLQQIQNCSISEININLNINQVENKSNNNKDTRVSQIDATVDCGPSTSSALLRITDLDIDKLQNGPLDEMRQSSIKPGEVVNHHHIHLNINGNVLNSNLNIQGNKQRVSQKQPGTVMTKDTRRSNGTNSGAATQLPTQTLKISSKLKHFKSPKSANTSVLKNNNRDHQQLSMKRCSSKLVQKSPKKAGKRPSSHLQHQAQQHQYNTSIIQKNKKTTTIKQSRSPNPSAVAGSLSLACQNTTTNTQPQKKQSIENSVKKSDSAQIMKRQFSRLKGSPQSSLLISKDHSKSQVITAKKQPKKSPSALNNNPGAESSAAKRRPGQTQSMLKAYSSHQIHYQQSSATAHPSSSLPQEADTRCPGSQSQLGGPSPLGLQLHASCQQPSSKLSNYSTTTPHNKPLLRRTANPIAAAAACTDLQNRQASQSPQENGRVWRVGPQGAAGGAGATGQGNAQGSGHMEQQQPHQIHPTISSKKSTNSPTFVHPSPSTTATLTQNPKSTGFKSASIVNPRASFSLKNSTSMAFLQRNRIQGQERAGTNRVYQ